MRLIRGCILFIQNAYVIWPVGITDGNGYIVDTGTAFMNAADASILCPAEEHDHMGIFAGPDDNITRLKFIAADFCAA